MKYQHKELGYLICGQSHLPGEDQAKENGLGLGIAILNENSSYFTGELEVKEFCFQKSDVTKNRELSASELDSLNADGFSDIEDTETTHFFNYSNAKFYTLLNGTPIINPVFFLPNLGLGGMYGVSLGHRISKEVKIQLNENIENVEKDTGNDFLIDARVGLGAMVRYKFLAMSLRVHLYVVQNFELESTGGFNNRVHLYGSLIFSRPDIKTRHGYYEKYNFVK